MMGKKKGECMDGQVDGRMNNYVDGWMSGGQMGEWLFG